MGIMSGLGLSRSIHIPLALSPGLQPSAGSGFPSSSSNISYSKCGIKAALPKLEEDSHFGCRNVVELEPLAVRGVQTPRCPSSVVFCDWGSINLRKEQITSATFTAFAYFKIGCQL